MRLTFLGTGSAWRVPEIGCDCSICGEMRRRGESRSRTSLYLEAGERILIDCGPDITRQWEVNKLGGVDAVVITHEHGDHYLGLDELEALRRSAEPAKWQPIPVYATEMAWETIEQRFAYLLGKALERRVAQPGKALGSLKARIVPFKTFHGPVARGAVGYAVTAGRKKLVYTSDLLHVEEGGKLLQQPEVLVIQTNWVNEPRENRPSHLSLQRALAMIQAWQPRGRVFLVHISDADPVPGDPANVYLKKVPPTNPLRDPKTGKPYPIPTCQEEWQALATRVFADRRIAVPVQVAWDGLTVEF
jgi:phosphoribosyl 1,2-cyclic phosphate phosphodiesterase